MSRHGAKCVLTSLAINMRVVMKKASSLSRRNFLQSSGTLTGMSLLRIASPALFAISQAACTAKEQAAAFKVLTEFEAADLTAIAARIIPTTDTPGATEAGVIYFFDNALAAEMSGKLGAIRQGLVEFNAALQQEHAGTAGFADLTADEQDTFLTSRETSDFFALTREMTIFGFFAMSSYGGNRNTVGWDLIGFKGHHGAWQYPFGEYDAEIHGGTIGGE